VRKLPLVERKGLLMVLIMGAGDYRLRLSDDFDDGAAFPRIAPLEIAPCSVLSWLTKPLIDLCVNSPSRIGST
jgi:hypothetical protein